MSLKRTQLCEGVNLNVLNTTKFKNNYMSVQFAVGLSKETAAMNALLPLILTHATKSYPSMEKISAALDMLYASSINTRCYKKGEVQFFGFNLGILNNSYAPDGCDIIGGTLDILHEIIFRPYLENGLFASKFLHIEKKNLSDRISAQINDKNSYAVTRANEEMCREEKFGISALGNPDDVMKIDASSLYSHYMRVLSEARVEIFFIGDYNEKIDEKIKKTLCFSPRKTSPLTTEVRRFAKDTKEITEEQQILQGKLSVGFRTGKVLSDGDYYKFVLFNEIYGGSPTSKLFMNVREKLSLCYYCKSIPEPQKGIMIVTAGIEVSNKETAKKEILAQLDEIKNGNITDEEFNSAVRSVLNSYREIDDSPESIESWYLGRLLAGLFDSPHEAAKQILSVTPKDVEKIASGISLDTVYFMCPCSTEESENE